MKTNAKKPSSIPVICSVCIHQHHKQHKICQSNTHFNFFTMKSNIELPTINKLNMVSIMCAKFRIMSHNSIQFRKLYLYYISGYAIYYRIYRAFRIFRMPSIIIVMEDNSSENREVAKYRWQLEIDL